MSQTPALVTIRPYQPADQPQIEWLYSRTPPAGQVAWRRFPVPDELRRISEDFTAFWVATEPIPEGEAVVGMTAIADAARATDVTVPEFLVADEPTARLRRMAVAPERWRVGIGRQLVMTAVAWARDNGYRSVILETTVQQEAAVALYRATGFTEAGRTWLGRYELVWFRMEL